ncbi:MAG: hydroxymethylglutaryl-CoA lyase [Reyranellaceae bacterium]
MSDLPSSIDIHEEGPREGFQIEPGPISSADKVRLIEALAETGLKHVQICSFVSARVVPSWADAEDVTAQFRPKTGVTYTSLWFNDKGLERALAFRDKLTLSGAIALCASEAFTRMNLHRSHADNLEAMRKQTALHVAKGVPVKSVGVMAAFGCNFQGDIAPGEVVRTVREGLEIGAESGAEIGRISLADTMGWATPPRIERVVGEVRNAWPDMQISLHLHDTRGMAVANAMAGLRMGVQRYDSTVGGLGGCPFAGQKGAAGNIATEELVMLCEEMGVRTGVDLEQLIEVGRMAEEIVGHPLPSELLHGGALNAFRRAAH